MMTSNPALMGTAGGTFLSVVPNLDSDDVLRTVLLAAIGATVSFGISMVLKFVLKKYKE